MTDVFATPPPSVLPPKRSRKGWWIGLGVAVVLLVGVGVAAAAYALVFSKLGGADSPEAAVEQLISGAEDEDLVAIYGVVSPAEIDAWRAASGGDDLRSSEARKVAEELSANVSVTFEGVQLKTEVLEEGLARVTLTSGSVRLDGDPAALADTLTETFAEPLESIAGLNMSKADRDEMRAEVEGELDAALPQTWSVSDLPQPNEVVVMAVEEDGAWYVSPLLTLVEYGMEADDLERGSLLADDQVAEYATPEAAAEGLVAGVEAMSQSGDIADLARTLPLAERRLLMYLGGNEEGETFEFSASEPAFTAEQSGDTALVHVNTFEFSFDGDGLRVADGCVSAIVADPSAPAVTPYCPTSDLAKAIGLDDVHVVAVEESGSWFVSPTATSGQYVGVVNRAFQAIIDGEYTGEEFAAEFAQLVGAFDASVAEEDWDSFFTGESAGEWDAAGPAAYGDDPELDALWDACAAGDMDACDELFWTSPPDSEYEEFADSQLSLTEF